MVGMNLKNILLDAQKFISKKIKYVKRTGQDKFIMEENGRKFTTVYYVELDRNKKLVVTNVEQREI